MSWPIKVVFQPEAYRELTREFKTDPNRPVICLLIDACTEFHIDDPHKHKKTTIKSVDTIRTAGLLQGSTLLLTQRLFSREPSPVTLSLRISHPSGPLKLVARFTTQDLLLAALQCIPTSDSSTFNALKSDAQTLPVVTIMGATLNHSDLARLRLHSFEALDIKGSFSLSVTHVSANQSSVTEFAQLLNAVSSSVSPVDSASDYSESCKAPPAHSRGAAESASESMSNCKKIADSVTTGNAVTYSAVRLPRALTRTPDIPDAFFELSAKEIADFQRSYQSTTKSLMDKPLVSAKYAPSVSKPPVKDHIDIKFMFPDHVQVQATFSSNTSVGALHRFIHETILDGRHGPPYTLLSELGMLLSAVGIVCQTRIIVKCNTPLYRAGLHIRQLSEQ